MSTMLVANAVQRIMNANNTGIQIKERDVRLWFDCYQAIIDSAVLATSKKGLPWNTGMAKRVVKVRYPNFIATSHSTNSMLAIEASLMCRWSNEEEIFLLGVKHADCCAYLLMQRVVERIRKSQVHK